MSTDYNYFDTVGNLSTLKRKTEQTFTGTRYEYGKAASRWTVKDLLAVRAICHGTPLNLGSLVDPNQIQRALQTPGIEVLISQRSRPAAPATRTELLQRYYQDPQQGRQDHDVLSFWAAMFEVLSAGEGVPQVADRFPVRDRRQRQFPSFVPSRDISASPETSGDESEASSFRAEMEGNRPEEAVLDIGRHFCGHILVNMPSQSTLLARPPYLVQFSPERRFRTLPTANQANTVAAADSELRVFRPAANGRYEVASDRMCALIEAKRRFNLVDEGKPEISNALLGQLAGEALSLRCETLAASPTSSDTVFIIFLAQHFLRVFRFVIPRDLLAVIQSPGLVVVPNTINDCLDISATRLFNLEREDGRRDAAAAVVALALLATQ